jgi:hypothetical protein
MIDDNQSVGVVTRLEQFDNQYLHRFFVKSTVDGQEFVDLDKAPYEDTPEDYQDRYGIRDSDPLSRQPEQTVYLERADI